VSHIIRPNQGHHQFAAVFRLRSDGDWDFMAMVNIDEDEFPVLSQADTHQAMELLHTIGRAVEADGDDYLIDFFPEPEVPMTYEFPRKNGPKPHFP
jgi:hypothetical protein